MTQYKDPLPHYGDLYTREIWLECVKQHGFIDYDGHGHPVKDGLMDSRLWVRPSMADQLPDDATHIMWFNR